VTVDLGREYADRYLLAETHESGHVVCAWALGRRPRGVTVSRVHDQGEVDVESDTPLTHTMIALAGERAERMAASWYEALGHPGSGPDRALIDALGVRVTPRLVDQVDAILWDNRRRVHGLAAILERRHELTGEELREVLA
jgi:hypothetical protein